MQPRARARQPLTFESAESQVLANMRAQRVGLATVAELGLPESFLRRVAGRVLQLSYQENFRLVVADKPGAVEQEPWKPGAARADLKIIPVSGVQSPCLEQPVASPPSRGFFPAVLGSEAPLPHAPDDDDALASLVARGLARDGLIVTAVKALLVLRPTETSLGLSLESTLGGAGFPCDLLRHFTVAGLGTVSVSNLLEWLLREVVPLPQNKWPKALRAVLFSFQPTAPNFRAASDSGQARPQFARVQLSRGGYWMGPGDGGSIDVLQQVAESLSDLQIVASIEARHLDELRGALADWPRDELARLQLLTHDHTVSQWAQDNAKPGYGEDGPQTLIPRFASRGEELSLFVPGDTFLVRGLVDAGLKVNHSPLLFQGGNLLVVEEPKGRRVLLIGEAEVYRNQCLGFSRDQAIDALTIELGCDKAVVLPAASIHIDYEVSCRAHGDRVVAFVLDSAAGAKLVVQAALGVMTSHDLLDTPTASRALTLVAEGKCCESCRLVWGALAPLAVGPGRFPIGLAAIFREGNSDSGVGNFHRFMAALDLLMASDPRSTDAVEDSNLRVYLRSVSKREDDRTQLRSALRSLGWTVCPLPGIGQGDRSINPVNGLHTTDAYLMPVYGGLYRPLDEAAAKAARDGLGPDVRICPIRTAESQRRDGALRCSVSLL